MKLTVCFGDTKIVVPCGSGDISIRDLAFSSLKRVRHTLPKLGPHDRVVVHSVTIARDGGILDWDDLVRDVLDDRELVTAHYSIATLAVENASGPDPTCSSSVVPSGGTSGHVFDPLFPQLCSPLVVDLCSDSGAGGSTQSGPQSTEASGSGGGGGSGDRGAIIVATRPTDLLGPEGLAGDCSASASSSSLSLNLSSASCSVPGHLRCPHISTEWQSSCGGAVVAVDNSDSTQTIRAIVPQCSGLSGSPGDCHGTIKRSPVLSNPRPFTAVNGDMNELGDHHHHHHHTLHYSPIRARSPAACDDQQPHGVVEAANGTSTFPKLWHKAFPPTPFELLPAILSRRRDCLAMNWDSDEEEEDADVDFDEPFDSPKCSPNSNRNRNAILEQSMAKSIPQVAVSTTQSGQPEIKCDLEVNSVASPRVSTIPVPDIWPLPPPPPQLDKLNTFVSNTTSFDPVSNPPVSTVSPIPLTVPQPDEREVIVRCAAVANSVTPMLQTCLLDSSGSEICVYSEANMLNTPTITSASISPSGGMSVSSNATLCPGAFATPPTTPDTISERTVTAIPESVNSQDFTLIQASTKSAIPNLSTDSSTFAVAMSPTPLLQPVPVPPVRLNSNRFGSTFTCVPPVPTIPEVEEEEEDVKEVEELETQIVADGSGALGTTRRNTNKTNEQRTTNGTLVCTSKCHQLPGLKSTLTHREGDKTGTVKDEEAVEEDYPLLRPDYFVGPDRSDSHSGLTHILEKGHFQRQSSFDECGDANEPGSCMRRDFHVALEEYDGSGTIRGAMGMRVDRGGGSGGGIASPAVLRWLESTQVAALPEPGGEDSPSNSASSVGTTTPTTKTTSDRLSNRMLNEDGVRETTLESEGCPDSGNQRFPGTVLVRLTNTTPGENLGIQIKPVFMDRAELISQGYQVPIGQRIEAGLEVHHIMPNGRVAREGFLSVGDRILSIDGVSLIGVPFERGRDLFQAALKKSELSFHVLRKLARLSQTKLEKPKSDLPSCRLIVVPDMSDKAKEAESTVSRSSTKPAPPPPPRRSPHTMLTRIPAGVIQPLIEEFFQEQTRTAADTAAADDSNTGPVLPPKLNDTSRIVLSASRPPLSECISIQLKKGTNGLGFSLTSRDITMSQSGSTVNERIVCVKNILPGGAALLDGRLRSGDRLVQVDGFDVTQLGQANTVALLREKPVHSYVDLLVWRAKDADEEHTAGSATNATTNACQSSKENVSEGITTNQGRTQDVEKQAVQSSISVPSESQFTKTSLLPSPNHLPTNQLYKNYAIDPTQYTLLQLHISLPGATSPPVNGTLGTSSGTLATVPSANISGEIPGSVSTAHPVTLGVSVSVRSLNNQPISKSHSQDTSNNAVFVRTVIEGGPAHQDGRLKIGDRLLTIDGEPLSGISSLDALNKLKTVIARDMAENRPHVCLLIARSRSCDVEKRTPKTNTVTTSTTAVTATVSSNRASTRSHATSGTRETSGQTNRVSANLPSTSLVVSADVHPPGDQTGTINSDPQNSNVKPETHHTSKSPHLSRAAHKNTTSAKSDASLHSQPKQSNRCHAGDQLVNGISSGPKRTVWSNGRATVKSNTSGQQPSNNLHSKQMNNSSEGINAASNRANNRPRTVQHSSESGEPVVASVSSINRDQDSTTRPIVPRSPQHDPAPIIINGTPVPDRVYRCDSQGTISSTEIPEDEIRLSDHNVATDPHTATNHTPSCASLVSSDSMDMEGSAILSDPETERYSSSLHRRPRRYTYSVSGTGDGYGTKTMHTITKYGSSHRPPYRVIVRQPVIDLSQMVLVPFDAEAWTGPVLKPRSALTAAERAQLVESAADGHAAPGAQSHGIEDLLARNRRLFSSKTERCSSKQSKVISSNVTSTVDGPSRGMPFHYDSDSGTSRQLDSFTCETGHSNQSLKKQTVMTKLLGFVKSGTQRRSIHSDLTENSVAVQVSLPSNHLRLATTPLPARDSEGSTKRVETASKVCEISLNNSPKRSNCAILPNRMKGGTAVSGGVSTGPQIHTRLADYCTLNSRPTASLHMYHSARQCNQHSGATSAVTNTTTTDPKTCSPVKHGLLQCSSSPNPVELDHPAPKPRTQAYADLAFVTESPGSGDVKLPCMSDRLATLRAQIPRLTDTLMDAQPSARKSAVNRLYDNDISSCSTAYESVVEFLTTTEGSISPRQKTSREVYEDAEALYRYLADLKHPTGSDDESNTTSQNPSVNETKLENHVLK